jgi:hypothetical protein
MMKDPAGRAPTNCCDGKVVKVSGDTLTSTCEQGDEHHYTVAEDAKVTCDGEECDLSDLKEGSTIRMTLCNDDKNKVIAVDCGEHIPKLATM